MKLRLEIRGSDALFSLKKIKAKRTRTTSKRGSGGRQQLWETFPRGTLPLIVARSGNFAEVKFDGTSSLIKKKIFKKVKMIAQENAFNILD